MDCMSIKINKLCCRYDIHEKNLIIEITEGTVLHTEVGANLAVNLIFDAHTTWLMGEMVDTFKRNMTGGFGVEPKTLTTKI